MNLYDKSLIELNTIQVAANDAKLWAKVRAQNWLNLYDARTYPLEILLPEGGPSARPAQQEENTPAIMELSKQENKLYPNPVTDKLQVYYHTDNMGNTQLELYDMMGRKAMEISLQNGINTIDVERLQSGIYYYKILEDENITLQGKVIKE